MKVKEFIEELQKLDQEKEIWLIYDAIYNIDLSVYVVEDDNNDYIVGGEEIKKGDYIISAW